ncbi:hypothetical protein ACOSP7_026497 [Xanthoceras sorbifolium]
MGSCLSKKKDSSSSSSSSSVAKDATLSVSSKTVPVDPTKHDNNNTQKVVEVVVEAPKQEPRKREEEKEKEKEEEGLVKKEIFVIKHRKSHERRSNTPQHNEPAVVVEEEMGNNVNCAAANNMVRTSSCTKEEVDAILIQCGRLSRSNSSGNKVASSGRKYSGSKRSYDFDHNDVVVDRDGAGGGDDDSDSKKKVSDEDDEKRQHRQRHRQSSSRHSSSPSSQGRRRRTPSREREQQQRSGSRERGNGGGGGSSSSGRRVSRSPGRRSENNNTVTTTTNNGACNNRPGKMVSVPASVASLVMDKSNNNGGGASEPPANAANGIKRISVKRNVGADQAVGGLVGSRSAASPRSLSPARANANVKSSNENQQQQPSLSRNSSRKAEHSPCRRNPLSEIDPNSLAYPQSAGNKKAASTNANRVQNRNREIEGDGILVKEFSTNLLHQAPIQKPEIAAQGTNHKTSSRGTMSNKVGGVVNCTEREHQRILEEAKAHVPKTGNNVTLTTVVAASGADNLKPQTVTRSRSSRLSRDLDINPETLLNPSPSYTTLLLEDIQNFHQKNNNNTPSISLPACVSKACSILEAVADLNSTTSSNFSGAFSEDRKSLPADHSNNKKNSINLIGKKMPETNYRDPFVESEVLGSDDLMEPSFHKYVTVRRGGTTLVEVDLDDQESSGSNSIVGGSQQNWSFSSSSWEPNSAESTDRWTSRSNTRDQSPLGFQRHPLSETGCDEMKTRKGFSGTKRDNDHEKVGIGRGRVGAGKGLHTVPVGVTAST